MKLKLVQFSTNVLFALVMGVFWMPLSLLSAAFMLVVLPKRSTAFALAVASFVSMICALVVTLGVEVPIDNQIKEWTVNTLPSGWQALRDRWEFFHTVRTFVSIAAFALVSSAGLTHAGATQR